MIDTSSRIGSGIFERLLDWRWGDGDDGGNIGPAVARTANVLVK